MARRTFIHPDDACSRLGMVPTPGEGKWAKYDRRRHLAALGLTRYPGKGYKGFRYDAAEVDALAAKKDPVKKAA